MRLMLPFQQQPKIIAAFKAGYETVSKHLYLVLFPISLDLFLLFGFRITAIKLMESVIQRFVLPPSASPDLVTNWEILKTQAVEFFRYFSFTTFLRSFPVGVPSLFSVAAFQRNPVGEFLFIQLQQPESVFGAILGFSLIGLFFAYFLYRLTSRAVLSTAFSTEPHFEKRSLVSWLLIPIVTISFVILVIFPAMVLISLVGALFPFLTSIGYFFLTIILITLIIPVIFTPHLIILEHLTFLQALLSSFRTVRLTNAKTSTFIFLSIFVSYLTNMLWRIPSDDSWMLIVGLFGHALISTIVLAASFHYILDARKSVRDFFDNQMSESNLA